MFKIWNARYQELMAGRFHHLCVAAPLPDHGIFLAAAVPATGQEGIKR